MTRVYRGYPGQIVWLTCGLGPRAVILERLELRARTRPKQYAGIYYLVEILESSGRWSKGDELTIQSYVLSSEKRPARPTRSLVRTDYTSTSN